MLSAVGGWAPKKQMIALKVASVRQWGEDQKQQKKMWESYLMVPMLAVKLRHFRKADSIPQWEKLYSKGPNQDIQTISEQNSRI